uniref:transposase n=1 Tax=Pseudomonas syringae TaxID=317 RepID=UPI0035A1396E
MGKYTEQAKLAAVKEYCAGKAGLRDVARRHDVDFSCLRQWVAAYQIHGPAALKEKRRPSSVGRGLSDPRPSRS